MFAHKLRYSTLLLLLALILGSWSARTYLAELAITSFLQSSGLEDVTVNINQLDQNQSQLPRFGFTLLTASGRLQLDASDSTINYKPGQLAEGRVNSIVINNLQLHYQNTGEIQADSAAESATMPAMLQNTLQPVKIITALRSALRKYLIVDTLFIRHITLNGEAFAVLQGKTLQLKSTTENETLYAEFTLLDDASGAQSETLPQLVISKLSASSLIIDLKRVKLKQVKLKQAELGQVETSNSAAGKTSANLELNIHDKELTGNYQVNPRRLQRWLQPFTNIKGLNEFGNINGTLLFDFEPDKEIITTITAVSDKLLYKKYKLENPSFKLKFNTITDNPAQHIQIQKGSYIKAAYVSYQDFSLANSTIYMAGELTNLLNNWSYTGGFSSRLLAAKFQSSAFQLKDVSARVTANAKKINVSGDFSPTLVPGKFEFAMDHKLTGGGGKLFLKPLKPLDLNAGSNSLSQLLEPWPYPFDLLSGKIKLSSHATWSQKHDFSLSATINVDNAGGHVGKILFSGLSLDHELELLPTLHTISAGKIRLKHVDAGVIADNISTDLKLDTENSGPLPQLILHKLNGEILGGTFSAENLVYDPNNSTNRFNIEATNIDLAEIVKTQQLDDIVATGRIDGSIPVEINAEGIFIQDGLFINDVRNGTIRYNPATGTEQLKQNPITGIALDALRDFRYSYLSAGVNFIPEGRLTINLQLKGISPGLDTNRPVHLNINTEQNLLSLLKSLRYAQGISEKIDNKVRRLYEKNQ
jgi:hypothetical protein